MDARKKQHEERKPVKLVRAGRYHTLLHTLDGKLFACGMNSDGQLGLGHRKGVHEFHQVTLPDDALENGVCDIVDMSLGWYHSLILLANGTAYYSGGKQSGVERFTPCKIGTQAAVGVKLIGSGYYACVLVLDDGSVYGSGDDFSSPMGTFHSVEVEGLGEGERVINVKCGLGYSLLLTSAGRVRGFGSSGWGQLSIVDRDDVGAVKKICAGGFHSLALLENGDLYASGRNTFGQGMCDDLEAQELRKTDASWLHPGERVVDMAAGENHTLLWTSKGRVLACGSNSHEQLGKPKNPAKSNYCTKPIPVDLSCSLCPVRGIACGQFHSIVHFEDHSIAACGFNCQGQLGFGNTVDISTMTLLESTRLVIWSVETHRLCSQPMRDRIFTIMLLHHSGENYVHLLPLELLFQIFSGFTSDELTS